MANNCNGVNCEVSFVQAGPFISCASTARAPWALGTNGGDFRALSQELILTYNPANVYSDSGSSCGVTSIETITQAGGNPIVCGSFINGVSDCGIRTQQLAAGDYRFRITFQDGSQDDIAFSTPCAPTLSFSTDAASTSYTSPTPFTGTFTTDDITCGTETLTSVTVSSANGVSSQCQSSDVFNGMNSQVTFTCPDLITSNLAAGQYTVTATVSDSSIATANFNVVRVEGSAPASGPSQAKRSRERRLHRASREQEKRSSGNNWDDVD